MSGTTAITSRHLALPTDEEFDAARETLNAAIEGLGQVAFRLNRFYDLQDAGAGRGVSFTGSSNPVETYDVPTLERIGALFTFATDVERRLTELDEYHEGVKNPDGTELQASFLQLVEWLDVVRTTGPSGRVVRDEDDA